MELMLGSICVLLALILIALLSLGTTCTRIAKQLEEIHLHRPSSLDYSEHFRAIRARLLSMRNSLIVIKKLAQISARAVIK